MKYIVIAILVAVCFLGCEGGGLTAPPGWETGTDPSLPVRIDG